MRITIRGYAPIVIPEEYCVKEVGAFNGSTPYVAKVATRFRQPAYLHKKLPSKLLCLEEIKRSMLGAYLSFAEPLAGIGLTARLFDVGGKLYLNELDPSCRAVLEQNFHIPVTADDAFKTDLPPADAIFLDFNDFTLKRFETTEYGAVLARALNTAKKFVVLNNCSVFYLRYGQTSFDTYAKYVGKIEPTIEAYLKVEAEYFNKKFKGWYVIKAAYFRDTAFLLFSKQKKPFRAVKIEPTSIVSVGNSVFD